MNDIPLDLKPIELIGRCNTSDEEILENVKVNIRRKLSQVKPFQINPATALLVCGGPSLNETKQELVEARENGGKLFTVNGSYNWCLENGLAPSAYIGLDAREFNTKFIETPVEGCRYLLASQCHPKVFDLCKDRNVFIWHACSGGDTEFEILNEYYFNRVFPITIGTTVGVRGISLIRMLGFDKIEIFGLDSCWFEDQNHSYEQKENSKDIMVPVWLKPEGREDKIMKFVCSPWMVKQTEDFMQLVKERGDLFQLNVHGNGLIANLLRTGAEIQLESSLI